MPVEIYFAQTFKRERLETTVNEIGGTESAWNDKLEFTGRLRPLTGDKQLSADRQTIVATHRLYCPVLDIIPKDRIVDSAGNIYRVVGIVDTMSAGEFLTCDLFYSEHDQDAEPEPEEEAGEENGGI